MPSEVRVVSEPVYKKWLAAIKEDEDKAKEVLKQAAADLAKRRMAMAEAASKQVSSK